jgi:hypothetical protein
MAKKVTHEEVVERFNAQGLEMLEEYTKARTKVSSCCMTCGYKWRVAPYSVSRGSGCPRCAGIISPSQSQVVAEFNGKGLELLEPYVNDRTSILMRCCKRQHIWTGNPGKILRHNTSGCPVCFIKKTGKQKD